MSALDATASELDEVRTIVARLVPGARVWVYGSRARRTAKRHSDLDLAIEAAAPLGLAVLGELRAAFDESSLRFKVDITDVRAADPAFVAKIALEWVCLVPGPEG